MKTALLIGLLLMPLAAAFEMPDLAVLKDTYNSNIAQVPGYVRALIGNERINAYLQLNDGTNLTVTATTEKGIIQTLDYGENEKPTLVVSTTEATADSITIAENPGESLRNAIDNKDIKIKAVGFKKVKWGLGKIAYKIASWFK